VWKLAFDNPKLMKALKKISSPCISSGDIQNAISEVSVPEKLALRIMSPDQATDAELQTFFRLVGLPKSNKTDRETLLEQAANFQAIQTAETLHRRALEFSGSKTTVAPRIAEAVREAIRVGQSVYQDIDDVKKKIDDLDSKIKEKQKLEVGGQQTLQYSPNQRMPVRKSHPQIYPEPALQYSPNQRMPVRKSYPQRVPEPAPRIAIAKKKSMGTAAVVASTLSLTGVIYGVYKRFFKDKHVANYISKKIEGNENKAIAGMKAFADVFSSYLLQGKYLQDAKDVENVENLIKDLWKDLAKFDNKSTSGSFHDDTFKQVQESLKSKNGSLTLKQYIANNINQNITANLVKLQMYIVKHIEEKFPNEKSKEILTSANNAQADKEFIGNFIKYIPGAQKVANVQENPIEKSLKSKEGSFDLKAHIDKQIRLSDAFQELNVYIDAYIKENFNNKDAISDITLDDGKRAFIEKFITNIPQTLVVDLQKGQEKYQEEVKIFQSAVNKVVALYQMVAASENRTPRNISLLNDLRKIIYSIPIVSSVAAFLPDFLSMTLHQKVNLALLEMNNESLKSLTNHLLGVMHEFTRDLWCGKIKAQDDKEKTHVNEEYRWLLSAPHSLKLQCSLGIEVKTISNDEETRNWIYLCPRHLSENTVLESLRK